MKFILRDFLPGTDQPVLVWAEAKQGARTNERNLPMTKTEAADFQWMLENNRTSLRAGFGKTYFIEKEQV